MVPARTPALRAMSSRGTSSPSGRRPPLAPGHTPGHTSLLITDPASETRRLLLVDAFHTTAQLTAPHWQFRSDADPALAADHRLNLLDRSRAGRTIIAGGHFAGAMYSAASTPTAGGQRSTSDASRHRADRHVVRADSDPRKIGRATLGEALVAERRPDRPLPPMAGTAAIGAVVHLLATAIEEDRDPSSMSGILADAAYRLLLA
jgi:glyoxylase-like metal-dependent hydrolase (beta-lactamase superfamily II)